MKRLRTNIAVLLIGAVGAFAFGCTGLGFTRVKTVTPSWAEEGNVAVQVYHAGGSPRRVEMQFYVDGTAVGPLQEVGRGFPELRFVTCELRFEVPPGQHTLRVEIVGTDIVAEEDFTVDEAVTEVWGSVRYQNRREQESDEPRLTIDFDGNRVKFAQQGDHAGGIRSAVPDFVRFAVQ